MFDELMTTKKEEKKNYEIVKELAVVGEPDEKGMQLKVSIVKWFGNDPKFDIRKWKVSGNGKKDCLSGLTLTKEEIESLTLELSKLMEA